MRAHSVAPPPSPSVYIEDELDSLTSLLKAQIIQMLETETALLQVRDTSLIQQEPHKFRSTANPYTASAYHHQQHRNQHRSMNNQAGAVNHTSWHNPNTSHVDRYVANAAPINNICESLQDVKMEVQDEDSFINPIPNINSSWSPKVNESGGCMGVGGDGDCKDVGIQRQMSPESSDGWYSYVGVSPINRRFGVGADSCYLKHVDSRDCHCEHCCNANEFPMRGYNLSVSPFIDDYRTQPPQHQPSHIPRQQQRIPAYPPPPAYKHEQVHQCNMNNCYKPTQQSFYSSHQMNEDRGRSCASNSESQYADQGLMNQSTHQSNSMTQELQARVVKVMTPPVIQGSPRRKQLQHKVPSEKKDRKYEKEIESEALPIEEESQSPSRSRSRSPMFAATQSLEKETFARTEESAPAMTVNKAASAAQQEYLRKGKKFPSVVFVGGNKKFECQICKKTFDSKQKLGGHKARAHPHAPCQRTDREQKKLKMLQQPVQHKGKREEEAEEDNDVGSAISRKSARVAMIDKENSSSHHSAAAAGSPTTRRMTRNISETNTPSQFRKQHFECQTQLSKGSVKRK